MPKAEELADDWASKLKGWSAKTGQPLPAPRTPPAAPPAAPVEAPPTPPPPNSGLPPVNYEALEPDASMMQTLAGSSSPSSALAWCDAGAGMTPGDPAEAQSLAEYVNGLASGR